MVINRYKFNKTCLQLDKTDDLFENNSNKSKKRFMLEIYKLIYIYIYIDNYKENETCRRLIREI